MTKRTQKPKRNCQVYWLTAPKTSLQTEGALETVSSVEDMEEGEIHDDTMEDIVVSQDENQIEEGVEEKEITRDKRGLVGNLKEQTKVCEDPNSKHGKKCFPNVTIIHRCKFPNAFLGFLWCCFYRHDRLC